MMQKTIKRLISLTNQTAGSGSVDLHVPGDSAVFYLDESVEGGTSTVDVDIVAVDPASDTEFVLHSFTQLNAVGGERVVISPLPDALLRVNWTVGGASPNVDFSVTAVIEAYWCQLKSIRDDAKTSFTVLNRQLLIAVVAWRKQKEESDEQGGNTHCQVQRLQP